MIIVKLLSLWVQNLLPFLVPLLRKSSEAYRNFSVIKSLRESENLQVCLYLSVEVKIGVLAVVSKKWYPLAWGTHTLRVWLHFFVSVFSILQKLNAIPCFDKW